jgi:ectoine hydroxylase-related dioxygenase (phytanoyl-CoA dioxygenase family)
MLSDAQIAEFRDAGCLVVNDVLDQEAILDPVRAEYETLLDGLLADWGISAEGSFADKLLAAHVTGRDWFQPMDISLPGERIHADTPMHFGPAVFDMITAPALLDVVQSLIGPEITSNPIQHVRIKPPVPLLAKDEARGHVGGTDWHQDRAVALEEADKTDMVTVWIAVTDATVDNGCLQVIPRATSEILPHCPQRQTSIADGFLDLTRATPLPVRSGGVVLLDPMIPHASLPNVSDGIRWSFDLRYNRTGQPTGRSHFPEFVARSRARPEIALHDWNVWRIMWENARIRLATTPHIAIHRWRSDSPVCA